MNRTNSMRSLVKMLLKTCVRLLLNQLLVQVSRLHLQWSSVKWLSHFYHNFVCIGLYKTIHLNSTYHILCVYQVTCQSNELSLMVVVVQTSKYMFQLNKEMSRKQSLQTYDMPGLKNLGFADLPEPLPFSSLTGYHASYRPHHRPAILIDRPKN